MLFYANKKNSDCALLLICLNNEISFIVNEVLRVSLVR